MLNQKNFNVNNKTNSTRNAGTSKNRLHIDNNNIAFNRFVPPPYLPPSFVPPSFVPPSFAPPSFVQPSFLPPPFLPPPFLPPPFIPHPSKFDFKKTDKNYHIQPALHNQYNHNVEEYDPANPWIEKSSHPKEEVDHTAGQPEYVPTSKKRKRGEDNSDNLACKKTNVEKSTPALTSINIDDLFKNLVRTGLIKPTSVKSEHEDTLKDKWTGHKNRSFPIESATTTASKESKQFQLRVTCIRIDPRITNNLRKGLLCEICGVKFRNDAPFQFLKDRAVQVSAEARLQNHKLEHSQKNPAKDRIYYLKLEEWVKQDSRNISIDYGEPIVVVATEKRADTTLKTKKRKRDEDVNNLHKKEDDDNHRKKIEKEYDQIISKYKKKRVAAS
ncbi:hypothetical protein HELRODRAFT_179819 [Helobdella robusta]|uniref:Uncharacterized protein n=1 Tax=Helobdella robusta TaxID=6412 RepID=T1FF68_HELRO|nr:hypothetical protein HELRODRAFT_179819 [Helobdella robusta]ESN94979.1 hypothetical protein HELRODRAFT_179819 [Helobdella robusta]